MTLRVADNVFAKLMNQVVDLLNRIRLNQVDLDRARFGIHIAAENAPTWESWNLPATYVLESSYLFAEGVTRHDFATLTIEIRNGYIFEDLLSGRMSASGRRDLMENFRKIFKTQATGHSGSRMVRLYRVTRKEWLGYNERIGDRGQLERYDLMLNFNLTPICDFSADGMPIPFKVVTPKH